MIQTVAVERSVRAIQSQFLRIEHRLVLRRLIQLWWRHKIEGKRGKTEHFQIGPRRLDGGDEIYLVSAVFVDQGLRREGAAGI
jgi:hypothetical protein